MKVQSVGLTAEDPLKQRGFCLEDEFEFASIKEDAAARRRTAPVHEHIAILFLVHGGTAFRAAKLILLFLVFDFEPGTFRFGLLLELGNQFLVLPMEVFVFLAVALSF